MIGYRRLLILNILNNFLETTREKKLSTCSAYFFLKFHAVALKVHN